MKILLTGFVPFLSYPVNPSQEVASALESSEVISLILPVAFGEASDLLRKSIIQEKPDLILSLGLASKRDYLSLERFGYNERKSSQRDNRGISCQGEKIVDSGPDKEETPWDLKALQKILKDQGYPVEISTDPGRYLCNEVYYQDLFSGVPSLFIHLPPYEKLPFAQQKEAIQSVIAWLKTQAKLG